MARETLGNATPPLAVSSSPADVTLPTVPAARRVTVIRPRLSARALLRLVIRDALDPAWGPLVAGRRAIEHAHGDFRVLRAAHRRLQAADTGRPARISIVDSCRTEAPAMT